MTTFEVTVVVTVHADTADKAIDKVSRNFLRGENEIAMVHYDDVEEVR